MIEAINVSKTFNDHQVLNDISVTFEKGKTNLIIGQSGSGKTVLMKCLVGLFPIDTGSINFDGRSFSAISYGEKKKIRQEIGMLFQGGALFDSMNVEENVVFPLSMFTDMSPSDKIDRANFCLKRSKNGFQNSLPTKTTGVLFILPVWIKVIISSNSSNVPKPPGK